MKPQLAPIKSDNLKETFISQLESLILSGELAIGERLPSERELAFQLGVSRPVVHEGLVDLAYKGLVIIRPRHGAVVADYRQSGSLALLESLINYRSPAMEPHLLQSTLAMRKLIEMETARLACLERSKEQLETLQSILKQEEALSTDELTKRCELDFSFHHQLAMASNNAIYPLLLNSFKALTLNLTEVFYQSPSLRIDEVLSFHNELLLAVEAGDAAKATAVMTRLLDHGERHLNLAIRSNQPSRSES